MKSQNSHNENYTLKICNLLHAIREPVKRTINTMYYSNQNNCIKEIVVLKEKKNQEHFFFCES